MNNNEFIRVAKCHGVQIQGYHIPLGSVYGKFNHWSNGWTYFIIDDFSQFAKLSATADKHECKFHWMTMKVEQGEKTFYHRTFDIDMNYYSSTFSIYVLFRFFDKNGITLHTETVKFISRAEREQRAKLQAEREECERRAEMREIQDLMQDGVIRKHTKNKMRHKSSSHNKGEIPLDARERVICHVFSNFKTTYREQ